MFCIEKALNFINDEKNLKLVASWIQNGKVTIDGVDLKSSLTPDHKYSIIKSIYGSTYFTIDEKKTLREKVFEGDTSDKAHQV